MMSPCGRVEEGLRGLNIAAQEILQLARPWQGKWRHEADVGCSKEWEKAAPWDIGEEGQGVTGHEFQEF